MTESNQGKLDPIGKISLIMPAFNAGDYVSSAIQSCLDQTYENWELIIVDDYSSDSTIKEIQKFNDPRIKLHKLNQNSGPGAARNMGLDKCSGEWITVLDADDAMCLNRLSTFHEVATTTGKDYVYYDNLLTWVGQGVIPLVLDQKSKNYAKRKNKTLSVNEWLIKDSHAKPFFHKSLLVDGSVRYPEDIRGPEDTVFLVTLCAVNKISLIKLATRSYIYRETPGSLSNRGLKQILAIKVAHTLLIEISNKFPSIIEGVERLIKKNNDFEEFFELKNLFRNRSFVQFLDRLIHHPKVALIVGRMIMAKLYYEFVSISRTLSRSLGKKLSMGRRSGA